MPLKDRTWAPQGPNQVDLSNLGDKRLFTCDTVPVVAQGSLVYTQIIWQGKTDASCPSVAIQAEHKDVLAHTRSETHWSTPRTMVLLIDNLWNGFVKPKMIELGLDLLTTRWAITMDVHTSHRDPKFLKTLRERYPMLLILFVPASCISTLISRLLLLLSPVCGCRRVSQSNSRMALRLMQYWSRTRRPSLWHHSARGLHKLVAR